MSTGAADLPTIGFGPRPFERRRDRRTAATFAVAFAVAIGVAVTAGTPGVIGAVYTLAAFAVWAQDFRRSWRVADDRLEVRRWVRWRHVAAADVRRVSAIHDEMGLHSVVFEVATGDVEIPVDDCREALACDAMARFVDACRRGGAEIDPAIDAEAIARLARIAA